MNLLSLKNMAVIVRAFSQSRRNQFRLLEIKSSAMASKVEKSLGSLFGQAQEQYFSLRTSDLSSTEPEFQQRVKEAFRGFLSCQVAIAQGQVYSANEGLEEFSAERLRFLLVSFYLAELSQLIVDDERGSHLLRAKNQLTQYLDEVERLGLMQESDAKVWQRGGQPSKDAGSRREEKLDGGRREMANKKRLREIRKQLDENEKRGAEDDTGIDEELFRESVLLEMQVAVRASLDALDLIEQELPLVERMEQMKKLEAAKQGTKWESEKPERAPRTPTEPIKVDLPNGYRQHVGASGQVTIEKLPTLAATHTRGLVGDREGLGNQVFRPHYNMATMSVEQAGEYDYQELMERQQRESQHAAVRAQEPDEDDVEHYDSVTVYKDRDWDHFCDNNAPGSGNTTGNLG